MHRVTFPSTGQFPKNPHGELQLTSPLAAYRLVGLVRECESNQEKINPRELKLISERQKSIYINLSLAHNISYNLNFKMP